MGYQNKIFAYFSSLYFCAVAGQQLSELDMLLSQTIDIPFLKIDIFYIVLSGMHKKLQVLSCTVFIRMHIAANLNMWSNKKQYFHT